ncbi:MAG: precorrin-6y C5,15-methyltransferase (decarboxylating) subunit CbiE [Eubacteriales bacterium]
MTKKLLYIIGAGMGHETQLTGQGVEVLEQADVVYAFGRISALYRETYPNIISCEYTTLIEKLHQEKNDNVAVLVSGDVGFFSMAKTLRNYFEDRFEVINIAGINSMQYLCAKLGISYENIKVLSLHGRNSISKLLGTIAYHEHTFLLTGGYNTTAVILDYLEQHLQAYTESDFIITIGDSLSMDTEKVITGSIKELLQYKDFSDLTVMFVHHINHKPKCQHYRDEAFIRSNVPMSKREIRSLAVDYLTIKKDDIVYDIGAGTGSVTVELASFAHEGMVYALEKNPEAYETIQQNVKRFGSYNVCPLLCNAMDKMGELPIPDKVFIGGSSGDIPQMLEVLFHRNPKVELLITAITLETLNVSMQALKERNLDYEVSCINSSCSKKLGSYHLMMANNPVYLIWARQGEALE